MQFAWGKAALLFLAYHVIQGDCGHSSTSSSRKGSASQEKKDAEANVKTIWHSKSKSRTSVKGQDDGSKLETGRSKSRSSKRSSSRSSKRKSEERSSSSRVEPEPEPELKPSQVLKYYFGFDNFDDFALSECRLSIFLESDMLLPTINECFNLYDIQATFAYEKASCMSVFRPVNNDQKWEIHGRKAGLDGIARGECTRKPEPKRAFFRIEIEPNFPFGKPPFVRIELTAADQERDINLHTILTPTYDEIGFFPVRSELRFLFSRPAALAKALGVDADLADATFGFSIVGDQTTSKIFEDVYSKQLCYEFEEYTKPLRRTAYGYALFHNDQQITRNYSRNKRVQILSFLTDATITLEEFDPQLDEEPKVIARVPRRFVPNSLSRATRALLDETIENPNAAQVRHAFTVVYPAVPLFLTDVGLTVAKVLDTDYTAADREYIPGWRHAIIEKVARMKSSLEEKQAASEAMLGELDSLFASAVMLKKGMDALREKKLGPMDFRKMFQMAQRAVHHDGDNRHLLEGSSRDVPGRNVKIELSADGTYKAALSVAGSLKGILHVSDEVPVWTPNADAINKNWNRNHNWKEFSYEAEGSDNDLNHVLRFSGCPDESIDAVAAALRRSIRKALDISDILRKKCRIGEDQPGWEALADRADNLQIFEIRQAGSFPCRQRKSRRSGEWQAKYEADGVYRLRQFGWTIAEISGAWAPTSLDSCYDQWVDDSVIIMKHIISKSYQEVSNDSSCTEYEAEEKAELATTPPEKQSVVRRYNKRKMCKGYVAPVPQAVLDSRARKHKYTQESLAAMAKEERAEPGSTGKYPEPDYVKMLQKQQSFSSFLSQPAKRWNVEGGENPFKQYNQRTSKELTGLEALQDRELLKKAALRAQGPHKFVRPLVNRSNATGAIALLGAPRAPLRSATKERKNFAAPNQHG